MSRPPAAEAAPAPTLVRVLGIDPGSVVTGYGIIESDGTRSFHVAHGHIRAKGATFIERLGHIHAAIGDVVAEWRPREAAVEQVFLGSNVMSALKLGQARGAALSAVVARSIPVSEYGPRVVKQVVTGTGAAGKEQVQTMVRALLRVEEALQPDAADGLAIAVCHAHSRVGRGASMPALPARRRGRGRGLRL